jgi:hypothetical protein
MTDKKNFLTKREILGIQDKKIEEVFVPQWGGIVRLRSLSSEEVGQIFAFIKSRDGGFPIDFKARLLSYSICDESGNRVFTDDDIQAINNKDSAAIDLIFEVAQRLSGVGKKRIDDPGKILTGSELKS